MALYSRPRNTRLLVVTLVMVSLLTITVDFRGGESGPLEAAGRASLSIVGAVQEAVASVVRPIAGFFSGIARAGSLQSENRELRGRVGELERQLAQRAALQRENERLTALLRLKPSLGLDGVAARVIGESLDNFEWSITIDKGSLSGVKKNMPVVTGEGLVGRVVQVAPNAAKVELILDPESGVAGRLANSRETGLVVGQRDRDLRMELVDSDVPVAPNEQVVTSGYQGGIFPPNVVIGYVSEVSGGPGSVTKSISVRPAVDFSSLEVVLVVTQA